MGFLAGIVLAATATATGADDVPAKPRFEESGVVSTNEGHATLRWSLPGAASPEIIFELEQSRDAAFADARLRHRGPESAYFVSGLVDGRSHFRVRAVTADAAPGPWSEALVVEVGYPERGQVVLLLVVGCLVFAGTAAAIALGWLRTRRGRFVEHRAGA